MSETMIDVTPNFERIAINSVVKVEAVDWGQITNEVSARSEFTIVRGVIYGKVVANDAERISLAFQVFESGNLRGVLSIPWVTIIRVTILEHADGHGEPD